MSNSRPCDYCGRPERKPGGGCAGCGRQPLPIATPCPLTGEEPYPCSHGGPNPGYHMMVRGGCDGPFRLTCAEAIEAWNEWIANDCIPNDADDERPLVERLAERRAREVG